MNSDTPRQGGRGSKKGKFLRTFFIDGPCVILDAARVDDGTILL